MSEEQYFQKWHLRISVDWTHDSVYQKCILGPHPPAPPYPEVQWLRLQASSGQGTKILHAMQHGPPEKHIVCVFYHNKNFFKYTLSAKQDLKKKVNPQWKEIW